MTDLNSFDFGGLQPLDESLLSEADLLEVLGGQDDAYVYNSECKVYIGCSPS